MITIVGAGFAGVEAAWAAASRGERVRLYEMRPAKMTPAHTTDYFAELVCSNSFKSKSPTSPAGQLKAEFLILAQPDIDTLIVDLTDVKQIDSAGISALLLAERPSHRILPRPPRSKLLLQRWRLARFPRVSMARHTRRPGTFRRELSASRPNLLRSNRVSRSLWCGTRRIRAV